ncbi:uncharacterized protein LOC123564625 [Mercenaria mercenaria]|uniref:uncharacterized protein LOC123564625 n=1 Tax=Mercenaria mercenaria TaxID=6596 RepID=UPI001E1D507A|nr:uncharacterized protein LOC123564625 [Mercenaria mercenaria]
MEDVHHTSVVVWNRSSPHKNSDIQQLEKQQRTTFEHFQGLPERAANVGVHILLGAEPIESLLDKNQHSLFLNICRLKGSTEHEILSRQLAMSTPGGKSFSTTIQDVLRKYSLPSARTLLNDPPSKLKWKSMADKAVSNYWHKEWTSQLSENPSLKYLQIQRRPTKELHNIWQSVRPREHEVKRAEIKVRLATGTYVQQTNAAKINKAEVTRTCQLCNKADENLQHFILDCRELQESRTKGLQMLKNILERIHPEG